MKQMSCPTADQLPVAATVTVLDCKGRLGLDPAPLALISTARGEGAAEQTACRALEDLATRLADMQDARWRSGFGDLPPPAQRFAAIAEQIGLTELAQAARHVATAASQADGVALEATMQRLERAFDLAVTHIWNYRALI